jgi:dolichyl-phosphate beta-glucosyltransferase
MDFLLLDVTFPSIFIVVIMFAMMMIFGIIYLFYPAITVAAKSVTFVSRHIKPITIHPQLSPLPTTTATSSSPNSPTEHQKPILSIIIPAFEEALRLSHMLNEAYEYLSQVNCQAIKDMNDAESYQTMEDRDNNITMNKGRNISNRCIEWIVVNDGSKDQTSYVYEQYVKELSNHKEYSHHHQHRHKWKLISFPCNEGKGAAVQAGMLASTGSFCLMVDADGATEFGVGLENLTSQLLLYVQTNQRTKQSQQQHQQSLYPILFGSRAHLRDKNHNDDQNTISMGRQLIRTILSEVFHYCAYIFVGAYNIRDTQCGFKLIPTYVAKHIFDILHLRRWAFDTEIVYLSNQLQYKIIEVSVPWHEVEGSKLHTSALNLALVSIGMLRDMICVRLCYTFGLWKIKKKQL